MGQAETKITETMKGVMIEFHKGVVTGERKLQRWGKIGGKKLLREDEHAALSSG